MSYFRRQLFSLATVTALAFVSPLAAQAQSAATKNKVVFQISDSDPQKWNLVLNNAKNVQDDLGAANVEIEIVAYGPGLAMIKAESTVGNRVEDAIKSGVKVVACENTMRVQKLSKADMLHNLGYVSAGVVQLMKRQQEGYAYIRP